MVRVIDMFKRVTVGEEQQELMDDIREVASALAKLMNEGPESDEKNLALARLQEAVMWANKNVSHNFWTV